MSSTLEDYVSMTLRLGRYTAGSAMLLGARHVPERLCGGSVSHTWALNHAITSARPFYP